MNFPHQRILSLLRTVTKYIPLLKGLTLNELIPESSSIDN